MDSADTLRQALGGGLWELLDGAAERRALRASCRALRAAVTLLIDTLALPLDNATCSGPATPHAMAAFHRRCPVATQLFLNVSLDEGVGAVALAASRFMSAYAAATQGGLPPVTHCTIHIEEERGRTCALYRAPFISLLVALPRLEAMHISYRAAPGALMVQLLHTLARCERLHTLALSTGCTCEPRVVQAIAALPRLRALSLDKPLLEAHLLAALQPLTQLERLGVLTLYRVGSSPEQLPSVRTLCQPWRGGGAGSGRGSPRHAMDNSMTGLEVGCLQQFPSLQRLEGFDLYCESRKHGAQRLALLPPAVRRLARCAAQWALRVDLSYGLTEAAMRHLPPGSLAALRNMCISGIGGYEDVVQLLEAAPALTCLTYTVHVPITVATLATWRAALRPLKRMACLQQLRLGPEQPENYQHAGALAALVRYLLVPEAEGGDCCRALARVVVVCKESWEGWYEAAAAAAASASAMLRSEGVAVQLCAAMA